MRRFILTCLFAGSIAGCSMDSLPFVYKPDVRQGTAITQEQVAALRAGMTRRQVEFVLGTPPLVDPFRTDRWDYVHAVKPGRGEMRSERLSVFFEDDRLIGVEGDFTPADPALRSQS